jgi:hypothetical protein
VNGALAVVGAADRPVAATHPASGVTDVIEHLAPSIARVAQWGGRLKERTRSERGKERGQPWLPGAVMRQLAEVEVDRVSVETS